MTKALVVLSGGQDSTLCLGWARQNFDSVWAITFSYGQRHEVEVEAACNIARFFQVESHIFINLGPGVLMGTSPLVNQASTLEQYPDFASMTEIVGNNIERTFVPMRNATFLTIAANNAAAGGILDLVVGVCESDTANYPDCRRSFIERQTETINAALGKENESHADRFKLHAPLIALDKATSILLGKSVPGVYEAWALSHTAYDGQYPPTSNDHASLLRAHGFASAKTPDPLVVRAWLEGVMDLPDTENYDLVRENKIESIKDLAVLLQVRRLHD